jgi:hypothetical protein
VEFGFALGDLLRMPMGELACWYEAVVELGRRREKESHR